VPYGAHPASCYPGYAYDRAHLAEWVAAATAGETGVKAYLERYVHPGEDAYRELVDPGRLTRWTESTAVWKGLFA
jgi:glutaconate CoA-transferase, subunit A